MIHGFARKVEDQKHWRTRDLSLHGGICIVPPTIDSA